MGKLPPAACLHCYAPLESIGILSMNEQQLGAIFAGRNPMLNWEQLTQNHELRQYGSYAQGWKLYTVEN